jgi:hypothetical protein
VVRIPCSRGTVCFTCYTRCCFDSPCLYPCQTKIFGYVEDSRAAAAELEARVLAFNQGIARVGQAPSTQQMQIQTTTAYAV